MPLFFRTMNCASIGPVHNNPRFRSVSTLRIPLALLLAGMMGGCSSSRTSTDDLPPPALSLTSADSTPSPRLFAAGDALELFVKEDSTLNGSYPVREGGYIVIPRAGRIQVEGLSRESAEARVKEALQKSQLTQATVLVERTADRTGQGSLSDPEQPRVVVFLTGAVARPGAHQIPVVQGRAPGLYEVILISGGLSRFAKEEAVEILRKDASGQRQLSLVNLREVRQGAASDPLVGEGDIIRVPERVFGF